MSAVEITRIRAVDDDLLEAFRRLFPRLSSSAAPLTAADLAAIIATPGTAVLIARERSGTGRIVGTTKYHR